jgi:transcriptional regulator with XRE-family HTH domain
VDDRRLGTVVRARRHQRGWRLVDLADSAGVGPGVCGLLERGKASKLSVRTARAIAAAVDLPLGWDIGWQRQELDRLLDAEHSLLAASVASTLGSSGWAVRGEVSFNHYGDRGRVDLLAFHPLLRILLVVEIKSGIGDMQDTLGRLDVKVRLGSVLAREVGWGDVGIVVPALVIGDTRTARNVIATHDALFARFEMRGRAALAWLRRPTEPWPSGMLWFANRRDSRPVTKTRVRGPSKRHDSHVA